MKKTGVKGKDRKDRWAELKKVMQDVTVVVEVTDIRDLYGTRLSIAEKMAGSNRLLIMANKADLIEKNGMPLLPSYAMAISAKNAGNEERRRIIDAIVKRSTRIPARALFIGYPNVGKSTLVNMLSERKAAKVAEIAGTTKNVQWIRVNDDLLLIDYKGVFPKNESRESLVRKNAVNANEDAEMHAYEFAARVLKNHKLRSWIERKFDLELEGISTPYELLEVLAKRRGWKIKGGELNIGQAARTLLRAMMQAPEM